MLLLEDDVRFRPDWRRLLALVVSADNPCVCCNLAIECLPAPWSNLARAWRDRVPNGDAKPPRVRPRVVPLVRPQNFFGSQAIYLPAWFVPVLWDEPRLHSEAPPGMAFDSLLNKLMTENPTPLGMSIVLPDLAQHESPPSVLNKRRPRRISHSFDWEAAWD